MDGVANIIVFNIDVRINRISHLEAKLKETIVISSYGFFCQNYNIASASAQIKSSIGCSAAIFLISITFNSVAIGAIEFKASQLSSIG